jgi:tetratricopeptide (TPR) repeat protein
MLSLYILVSLTFWNSSALPDSGSDTVFTQALESFKQNDLVKSREAFLQLVSSSPNDPVLLYNLGLVEMTDQHPGRALAYWRKALYLKPGYGPALDGLKKIEKLRIQGLQDVSWWQKIPRYVSLSFLLALNLLLGSAAIFSLLLLRRALKFELSNPSYITPVLLVVGTLLLSATSWLHYSSTHAQTLATVMIPSAAVHSSPTANSPALFDFREGDEVTIRRQNGNWYQVQKSSTAIGWLQKEHVFIHSGEPPQPAGR